LIHCFISFSFPKKSFKKGSHAWQNNLQHVCFGMSSDNRVDAMRSERLAKKAEEMRLKQIEGSDAVEQGGNDEETSRLSVIICMCSLSFDLFSCCFAGATGQFGSQPFDDCWLCHSRVVGEASVRRGRIIGDPQTIGE
jgi:hypothetical protein